MATKIIKLNNGLTDSNAITYVPVTTTEAVQHSWGTSDKQQLKSYLGDLKTAITTVATAELETRNNLAATYIKPGTNANQINYNLPNGTYGVITVNNVAHATSADSATTATELANAPSLSKTAASGSNTDSFNVSAGGKTGATAVSLTKAAASTYGVVKLNDVSLSSHTHSLSWDTSAKTDNAGTEITALVAVPSSTTTLGTTSQTATFTTYSLPTKKYVDDAVSGAFADVAAALKYKGTIGTGTATATHVNSLPASHNVGDVWVVSTNGNYAGKACEVGDYIVCNTAGTTANNAHWDVLNGENQVSQTSANKTIQVGGGEQTIATVDGTEIKLSITQQANVAHMSDFASYVKTISSNPATSPNGVITSAVKTNQDIKFTYTDVSSSGTATTATTLSTTAQTITPGWAQNSYGKITSVTGVSIKQDHGGTGTTGKLTYWNGASAHTAVTNSYGNATTKYVYVDGGVLKEGTLPTGNKEGKNIVGASATATADAAVSTNGNVYLNHIENSSVKSHHKITGSAPISVTATDSGATITISHSTAAGYKHIPTGGSNNQVLKYGGSSGTAVWGSLTEGLKYEIYNSTDDFTLDLGESTGSVSLAKTTF